MPATDRMYTHNNRQVHSMFLLRLFFLLSISLFLRRFLWLWLFCCHSEAIYCLSRVLLAFSLYLSMSIRILRMFFSWFCLLFVASSDEAVCVCVLWMEARTVRDTFTNNKQVNVILSQRYLFRTIRLCVCISWMISSDDHCFGNSLASTMTFRLPRERSIIGLGYTIVIFNAFAAGQQPLIRLLWTTAMSNCLLFYVR